MKKGILIFAHNSPKLDYGLLSLISGKLAKQNLKVPVSLATDEQTINWLKESNRYELACEIFDQIITVESPESGNVRKLFDGKSSEVVPFKNFNRTDAWDITPYDRTLMIDSDYLIFTDVLGSYWDIDQDIMIGNNVSTLYDERSIGYHDKYVSDTGVHMFWATAVMFTKNQNTKIFFDLLKSVRDKYRIYGDLYRFDSRQYRNDISFSVASHIFNGFNTPEVNLPAILTFSDRDVLYKINDSNSLVFMVSNDMLEGNYVLTSVNGIDIHVMNKQSIVRNADRLLEL